MIGIREGGASIARRYLSGTRMAGTRNFFGRLFSSPVTLTGAIILFIMIFISLFAFVIAPYDPLELHIPDRVQGPSTTYFLGTDEAGRDLLSNLLYAGRISLMAAASAEGAGILFGLPFGLIAGFWRGKIDDIIMRFMDGLLAFPSVLLALTIVGLFGTSLRNLILAIGITFMPVVARIVRASVIQERDKDYVLAASALGAPGWRIVIRHILPNSFAPLIVQISLGMAVAILLEASLSFLGLGVQPPRTSWGVLLAEGYGYITRTFSYVTFPGIFIFVTVWALNVLGDGLRDALDPRLRGA